MSVEEKTNEELVDEALPLILNLLKQRNIASAPIGFIDLAVYQPEKKGGKYTRDDKGLAQLFSDHFINKHRYNATRKKWMSYDGIRWIDDEGGLNAAQDLKLLQASLVIYSSGLSDDDYFKFVQSYGSHNKRKNVLADAQSVYPITDLDLDKDILLFNCQDCTIDLRTMQPHEHTADDLISKVSNVYYYVDESEREKAFASWLKFLDEIMMGDESKKEYLKRMAGYFLTASIEENCFFIFYGWTTRNGKSTLSETLKYMAGDYATTTNPDTFQVAKFANDGGKPSPHIASLVGSRIVLCSEAPQNMTFDSALLKSLTGGDTISARRLHQEPFEFKPQFKILMNTNHLPRVTDPTLFKSDRVRVITFDRQFSEAERDHKLKSKLCKKESISAIFMWACQGYIDYLDKGLAEPDSVKQAINKYEDESDTIGLFLAEVLQQSSGSVIDGTLVYEAYKNWIKSAGLQPLGKFNFFKILRERNVMDEYGTINGQTRRNVIKNYKVVDQWIPQYYE